MKAEESKLVGLKIIQRHWMHFDEGFKIQNSPNHPIQK